MKLPEYALCYACIKMVKALAKKRGMSKGDGGGDDLLIQVLKEKPKQHCKRQAHNNVDSQPTPCKKN